MLNWPKSCVYAQFDSRSVQFIMMYRVGRWIRLFRRSVIQNKKAVLVHVVCTFKIKNICVWHTIRTTVLPGTVVSTSEQKGLFPLFVNISSCKCQRWTGFLYEILSLILQFCFCLVLRSVVARFDFEPVPHRHRIFVIIWRAFKFSGCGSVIRQIKFEIKLQVNTNSSGYVKRYIWTKRIIHSEVLSKRTQQFKANTLALFSTSEKSTIVMCQVTFSAYNLMQTASAVEIIVRQWAARRK